MKYGNELTVQIAQAVNSGANSYICYGCASIVNNICYFSKSEILQDLLKETNIPRYKITCERIVLLHFLDAVIGKLNLAFK
jgi:hypothetical protein